MGILNFSLQTCKPGIPKRYLMFVAAVVWTFAGGMLLFRGFSILKCNNRAIILGELGCMVAGIVFYRFMFAAISLKHIHRIQNLQLEKPCIFSFFNGRSYLLMTMMITSGIALRISGIVPVACLSFFYIAMGTPLLISAFRFYYYACKNWNKQGMQPA